MRLPPPTPVVLVGPSGAGKSHWAARNFRPEQIVSSDALRAAVGVSEHDQRAGTDAFEVLDLIVDRRLSPPPPDRHRYPRPRPGRGEPAISNWPAGHRTPAYAILFDTTAEVCRARNRIRARPLPAPILNAQLKARDQPPATRHRRFRRRAAPRTGRGCSLRDGGQAGAHGRPGCASACSCRPLRVVQRAVRWRTGWRRPPPWRRRWDSPASG